MKDRKHVKIGTAINRLKEKNVYDKREGKTGMTTGSQRKKSVKSVTIGMMINKKKRNSSAKDKREEKISGK